MTLTQKIAKKYQAQRHLSKITNEPVSQNKEIKKELIKVNMKNSEHFFSQSFEFKFATSELHHSFFP